MNPDVKRLWVEALRSGWYSQDREHLCSVDKFNNIKYSSRGVLCNLYIKRFDENWEKITEASSSFPFKKTYFSLFGNILKLPSSVIEWAELDKEDPIISIPEDFEITPDIDHIFTSNKYFQNSQCQISYLDVNGINFPTIADLIERSL